MGGDEPSGNDTYQAQQQQTEAAKQAARDKLNRLFGAATGSGAATLVAPDRAQFTTAGTGNYANGGSGVSSSETDPWQMNAMQLAEMRRDGHSEANIRQVQSAPQWERIGHGDDSENVLRQPSRGAPGGFDEAGFNAAQSAYDQEQAALKSGAARDTLYQTVRDNAFNAGKRGLDEANEKAGRSLKFELFAKGLNGGSEDINQNAERGRIYNNGLLDLSAKADGAKAAFKGNDESTRLQLLQSIDAGMDQGSAMTSAVQQLQNNGDKASAEAAGTNLGDLFAGSSLIYNRSQAAQGKQAGTEWWNNYSPTGGRGSKSANGTISGVG